MWCVMIGLTAYVTLAVLVGKFIKGVDHNTSAETEDSVYD